MIEYVLEHGGSVRIEPCTLETANYAWTEFWMEEGEIWSETPGLGTFPRDLTPESLCEHAKELLKEGFRVVIEGPSGGA